MTRTLTLLGAGLIVLAGSLAVAAEESLPLVFEDGFENVADGTIAIYFDDMTKPVMTAVDKKFTWGQVGLGSFDDHGHWDDVKLHGVKVEKP